MTDKDNQDSPQVTKHFRFLLVLIMLTWLILGAEVLVNAIGGENDRALSLENQEQAYQISSIQLRQQVLENKVESISKELDIAMKTYLSPNGLKGLKNSKGGNLSLNENSKEDGVPDLEGNLSPVLSSGEQAIQGSKTIDPQYEKLAYDAKDAADISTKKDESETQVGYALQQVKHYERSNNLILSAVRLRDAVKSEQNFANELETLRAFLSGDDEIAASVDVLQQYADSGIESSDNLKEEFNKIAGEITSFGRKEKQDPDVWDRVVVQFSNLVQIQKIEADGSSNEVSDILARAYNKLLKTDLQAAADELKTLPEGSRVFVEDWIKKAEANAKAHSVSEDIFEYVTRPEIKTENTNEG